MPPVHCEECKHDFESTPDRIRMGRWCGYCHHSKRCPPGLIQQCDWCLVRCFASHSKAKYWVTERNDVDIWTLALNDTRLFWFQCDECPHQFQAKPNMIVSSNQWCSYCHNMKRCDPAVIQDCDFCRERSFGSHPRAIFWSDIIGNIGLNVMRNLMSSKQDLMIYHLKTPGVHPAKIRLNHWFILGVGN